MKNTISPFSGDEGRKEKIQNEADICYFNNWIIVVHYLEHYAHSISVSLFFSIYPSLFPFAHLLTRSFTYLALSVDLCLFDTSKYDRKQNVCVFVCAVLRGDDTVGRFEHLASLFCWVENNANIKY